MKKKKKILIWILICILIIAGIFIFKTIKQNIKENSRSFYEFINTVNTEPYLVHDTSAYSSSGGGGSTDKLREITSKELKKIIDNGKNLDISNSFLSKSKIFSENKKCFYSLNNGETLYSFCFLENKIVSYAETNGPGTISWYVPEYKDNKRSRIINSIPDLQSCNIDSDCTLESVGVCIPKSSNCKSNSANCDSGYRVSINNKYSFVWDGVKYFEDQCITNNVYASYEKHEYYKESCVQHMCNTSIVQGN